MTDHDALLAAILANGLPIEEQIAAQAEDTHRLAYADWLEENGQRKRAEFIRVQVELVRKFMPGVAGRGVNACKKLHRRIRELREIGTNAGGFLELPAHWGIPYWRRGFVESTDLSWADWHQCADAILARQPIERVTLTTWPDWDGDDHPDGILGLLKYHWPRIEFELPPVERVYRVTHEMIESGQSEAVRRWYEDELIRSLGIPARFINGPG